MTGPARGPRRRRRGALAVLVAAVVGVGVVAVSALDGGVTYYRTPSELLSGSVQEGPVRVGGLVLQGSLDESTQGSTLRLTDGATDLTVHYPHRFPDVVREGEGALVEGQVGPGGVFHAESVLLRHSNEYQPVDADG